MISDIQLKIILKRLHRIPRFNSYIMTKPKSVLEHSARTAIIYQYLGGKELLPALLHDMSEGFLGFDPPSPIKADIPGIKEYESRPEHQLPFSNDLEKDLCKLADEMELLLDLKEQQSLGNSTQELLDIYDNVLEEVMEKAKKLGKKTIVKKILHDMGK